MAVTAEQIRQKLIEAQSKGKKEDGQRTTGGDNASYPFWNIPENSEATVRFVPDGDEDNMFFWVKREVIKLPFQGVVGGDYPTEKEVTVTVPCVDMFGMTCPIIAHTRPWWKTPKEDLARLYYKKKSYIFQGFVVNSPMTEQNVPENPIRRFILNPSLYEIVEQSLMNPDMEDLPIDYVNGRDFKIKKTTKGQYANYQTSTWSFKTRSLNDSEVTAIDTFGLNKLKDFQGRVPDADELAAIKAMFFDSLDGKPYDMDSYGQYFRPYGNNGDNGKSDKVVEAVKTAASSTTAHSTQQVTEAAADQDEPTTPSSGERSSAQALLSSIRDRAATK